MNLETNCGPLSEMTTCACRAWRRRDLGEFVPILWLTVSTLQATGMMAFEKRSTITKRASHPLEVGSPVTMSTEMWVHGPSGTAFGLSGAALRLRARLCSLANLAAFDVGFDGLLHLGLPVFSEDQLLCFSRCLDVRQRRGRGNWAMISPHSACWRGT